MKSETYILLDKRGKELGRARMIAVPGLKRRRLIVSLPALEYCRWLRGGKRKCRAGPARTVPGVRMKQAILRVIAEQSIFSFSEIEAIYETYHSFDLIVVACDYAAAMGLHNLQKAASQVNALRQALTDDRRA